MDANRYRFVVRQYTYYYPVSERLVPQEAIGIGVYDSERDITVPHPISNFIKKEFRRRTKSLSSQSNPAYEITKFLNYVFYKATVGISEFTELRYRGLFGLTIRHGGIYISELSIREREGKLKNTYIKKIMRYMTKFYLWLKQQKILQENFEVTYKTLTRFVIEGGKRQKKQVTIAVSPFEELDDILLPTRKQKKEKRLKDFGKHRYRLVNEFLNVAEVAAPDIVLGICFEIFGGLRSGEVVNLTLDSITIFGKYGSEGIELNVDDRRDVLFDWKKETRKEQVKVRRYQGVLVNKRLCVILEKHLNRLDEFKKSGKVSNKRALFVSSKTGNPLTGQAFSDQFRKVRKLFLEELSKNGRERDYKFIASKPWATHIGRGLFTNFCFDIGMTITEVAIARGDSDINSVLDYIEEKTAFENLNTAMNRIREAYDADNKMHSIIGNSVDLKEWGEHFG